MIVSLAGWFLLFFLAEHLSRTSAISRILSCCGKNSLAVVILRFLCLKPVNLLIVLLYGLPVGLIAALPNLTVPSPWWIAFTVSGAALPVILNSARKKAAAGIRGRKP